MSPDVIVAICTAVALAGGALAWMMRSGWKFFRKLDQFFADWEGTQPRPGVKHRPGVMERLEKLEVGQDEEMKRLSQQDEELQRIRKEVTLNSGGSLKDGVQKLLRNMEGK